MDEMPAARLLSDAENVVIWEDLLEGIIIHLRDVAAEHAQLFETPRWIGTSFEIWGCSLRGLRQSMSLGDWTL